MVEQSHTSGFWPSIYEPFRQFGSRVADWIAPASEASSGDDAYTISVELPGVDADDVELSVDEGVLALKGEKRTSREEKGETWYFSERQYGAFSRSFRLPPDADAAKVSADMKDGVLVITVPRKAAGGESTRKVEIAKK
ncbi:glutamyl-tRNA amidotransferase [Maritimibacter sp. 55A14]|uniref:Hsp20/alpha crystallin family protein n=1 Tax=Maritimibacter sp. 55A14 TaxID=2174844 RepID=UPI000D61E513|nr:Hsp20/alpha crystallin family protein [Maritimibacter sp. 55A14]PWE33758.1 glutamyl-tRNA amidotransferase [Maritimibacter sp. 55A14]